MHLQSTCFEEIQPQLNIDHEHVDKLNIRQENILPNVADIYYKSEKYLQLFTK